jgi:hypothetical protein
MVWSWVVVGEYTLYVAWSLVVHPVWKSLLHDVGWPGYGRHVISAYPESITPVTPSFRDL